MKKVFKPFSIVAFCLALMLGSCVGDNIYPYPTPDPNPGEGGLLVRFECSATTTRSTAVSGAPAFNDGYLLLISGSTNIARYYRIHGIPANHNVANRQLYIGHLRTAPGVVLPAVAASVNRIVVIGNTELTNPAVAVGTCLLVLVTQGTGLSVLSQHNPGDLNLWGQTLRSAWVWHAGDQVYDATVRVAPTVARIEMQHIDACPDSDIVSFRVEAIFIDKHYDSARVDGFIPGAGVMPHANFRSRGTNSALFQPGQPGYNDNTHPLFPAGGALFDIIGQNSATVNFPLGDRFSVSLTGNNRWGYNMFAMQPVHAVGTNNVVSSGTRMPHIVIRLSNVRVFCEAENDTITLTSNANGHRYLTIIGMRYLGVDLPGIHASHVYQLNSLLFTEDYLGYTPNERPKRVDVEITLAEWNWQEVRPTGFHQPYPVSVTLGCFEDHTFTLGPAICSKCNVLANILYMWQYSVCGVDWTNIGTTPSVNNRNLTVTDLTQTTLFRRVAICVCLPPATQRIYTFPAQVTVPERDPASDFPLYVEIGEINGQPIRWATRNVDFTTVASHPLGNDFRGFTYHPAQPGMLFQWGSNTGWRSYGARRYWTAANQWSDNPGFFRTQPQLIDDFPIPPWNNNQGSCPPGWRLPSNVDFDQLRAQTHVVINRYQAAALGLGCRAGAIFGPGSSATNFDPAIHVFLPVGGLLFHGMPDGTGLDSVASEDTAARYWSSSYVGHLNAWQLQFSINPPMLTQTCISNAHSVRCVQIPFTQPAPASHWVPEGGTHTFTLGAATGGTGTITYQWQSSPNGTGSWTNISGATDENLTVALFTPTTHRFYRRVAFTAGHPPHHSDVAEITVWARYNVDLPRTFTPNMHDAGRHFQWGTYNNTIHHFPATGSVPLGAVTWYVYDDGAGTVTQLRRPFTETSNPCPPGWRLPTNAEFNMVTGGPGTSPWVTNWNNSGVDGVLFESSPHPNNQLFLPAALGRNLGGTGASPYPLPTSFATYWTSGHCWLWPCGRIENPAYWYFGSQFMNGSYSGVVVTANSLRCVVR